MALGVELPAVIAAADAVVLDLAVIERGAAMAAAGMEQAQPAVAVAKQDQILAERAELAGNVGGVGRKADRVPVAPQQFAHRRAAADLGQLGAGGGRLHGIGGAEIAIPLGDVHRRFLRPQPWWPLFLTGTK